MVRRTPRSGTTSPGVPGSERCAGGAASARAARDDAAAARAGAPAGASAPGAVAPAGGVSPGAAAPAAARSTSSRRMRPCGPLPVTSSSATPSSRASLRVVGAASGGPARGGAAVPSPAPAAASCASAGARGVGAAAPAGAAEPPFAAAPSASITASTEPTSSVSPGSPHSRVMTPSAGHGMTTVALSVWISTRSWCSRTRSPSATCQAMISAVAMPSPTSGRRNSSATAHASIAARMASTTRSTEGT